MQPQHPALIRAVEDGHWQVANMVHRCIDGRWLASLPDGTSVYAAEVIIGDGDAPAFFQSLAEQVKTLGRSLRHIPMSARTAHYHDACRYLSMAYGELTDAAQQREVSA